MQAISEILKRIKDHVLANATVGDEPATCVDCSGSGYVNSIVNGFHFAVPCRCRQDSRRKAKILELPARYRSACFKDMVLDGAKAKLKIVTSPHQSFFISGRVGAGKTFLAAAQYRDLTEKGVDCLWRSTEALLQEFDNEVMQRITSPTMEFITRQRHCHLFWDDCADFKLSEFRVERIGYLVRQVYENVHGVTLTCNLSHQELQRAKQYTVGTLRRIDELCTHISL